MNIIDANNHFMRFLKESPYDGFHLRNLGGD